MKKGVKTFLIVLTAIVGAAALGIGAYIIAGGELMPLSELKTVFTSDDKNKREDDVTTPPPAPTVIKDKTDDYDMLGEVPFGEYDISISKTGNLLGNLQSVGYIASKSALTVHSIDGVGMYKFDQNSEGSSYITNPSESGGSENYAFVNFADSKIVYIDLGNMVMYAIGSDGNGRIKLAENVSECLLYDKTVYYVKDGAVYSVPVSGGESTKLYEDKDKIFSICGLSNSRLYFTASSKSNGTVNYLTLKLSKPESVKKFFANTNGNETVNMQYYEGWLYYVKDTALFRKQIGVENEEKLADSVNKYVVNRNCVYFGRTEEQYFNIYELNTQNSAVKKVMALECGGRTDMTAYIAGEYVYAVGGGDNQLIARTSILTSTNDVMYFSSKSKSWTFSRS